ncbi:MAG: DUF1292 domain-containing protein [Clostridiales Family XIII bacterium]|jgi:hypothetical protein|nr:DUF1292 domain-containing protein [Clostridiales Family XIII bacterium]
MAEKNEDNIITLEFDDGTREETEILGTFGLAEKDYIALKPLKKNDGDVYIFVYEDISDDEYEINDIESEDEFKRAAEKFDSIINSN